MLAPSRRRQALYPGGKPSDAVLIVGGVHVNNIAVILDYGLTSVLLFLAAKSFKRVLKGGNQQLQFVMQARRCPPRADPHLLDRSLNRGVRPDTSTVRLRVTNSARTRGVHCVLVACACERPRVAHNCVASLPACSAGACVAVQGLLQLAFVFMQASTVTASMAIIQLLQAARRCRPHPPHPALAAPTPHAARHEKVRHLVSHHRRPLALDHRRTSGCAVDVTSLAKPSAVAKTQQQPPEVGTPNV